MIFKKPKQPLLKSANKITLEIKKSSTLFKGALFGTKLILKNMDCLALLNINH